MSYNNEYFNALEKIANNMVADHANDPRYERVSVYDKEGWFVGYKYVLKD